MQPSLRFSHFGSQVGLKLIRSWVNLRSSWGPDGILRHFKAILKLLLAVQSDLEVTLTPSCCHHADLKPFWARLGGVLACLDAEVDHNCSRKMVPSGLQERSGGRQRETKNALNEGLGKQLKKPSFSRVLHQFLLKQ